MSVQAPIHLSVAREGRTAVVHVQGEMFYEAGVDRLPHVIRSVVNKHSPEALVLHVKDVRGIDLEGIAAIMQARHVVTASGGRFLLVDGQPRVRRRLELAGVLSLLEPADAPSE